MTFLHENVVSNDIETKGQQYLFNLNFNSHFQVAITLHLQRTTLPIMTLDVALNLKDLNWF